MPRACEAPPRTLRSIEKALPSAMCGETTSSSMNRVSKLPRHAAPQGVRGDESGGQEPRAHLQT